MVHSRVAVFFVALCLFVSLPVFAITRTWNGSVNANWSAPANWSPAGIPDASDSLVFPSGASNKTMTNDLPALNAGPMTFSDGYTVNGNELTLFGDVSITQGTFNTPLKVGAGTIHIGNASGSATYGSVDVNGQSLTIDAGSSTVASLNGSGSVLVPGGSIVVTGDGTFSGTINQSMSVRGSMPNANVTYYGYIGLSGTGSVGDVTLTSSWITPGNHNPNTPGDSAIGVLHTKSLSIGGGTGFIIAGSTAYRVELVPGSLSDSIQVTGSVTFDSPYLYVSLLGVPAVGQSFTIIDNDGTDPVNGTFRDLPEGSTITVGSSRMTITYHGGDGNDVVLQAVSADKTWLGSVSGSWSDARNWSPQAIPVAGEPLVFPAGASNKTMTNDLPALSVGAMTFGDGYTINGNELTLTGNVAITQGTFNAPLKVGAAIHIGNVSGSTSYGAIDVNGQALTIDAANSTVASLNGSGSVLVPGGGIVITDDGTFSGTINQSMSVRGSMPNAHVTFYGYIGLSGTGTVGDVTLTSSWLTPGAHNPNTPGDSAIGVLHTKSLSIGGGTGFIVGGSTAYRVELVPGSLSDSVQVTGTVTFDSPYLYPSLLGVPAAGQSFTIIDNDGTDPVNGTFRDSSFHDLPERATLTVGGYPMRISYSGGDGNDIVLTTLAATTNVLTQNASATTYGETWTLTATVSSSFGTPAGSVAFSADGVSLGVAPVVNGAASLTVPFASVGTRTVVATFLGTGAFGDSVSGTVVHVVTPGQTTTNIAANQPNIIFGQTAHFTVTVSAQAPAAGQPSGSVTILADGATLGAAPIVNGTAAFETSALHAGVKSITATYAGDANFAASSASAIQQNVGKAQTEVDARSRTAFVGESPLITVFVNVTPGSSLAPTGSVTLSEGGAVVGAQTLAGGVASFSLSPLPEGDHTFVVNYIGDTDFVASSATIVQSVVAPSVSIQGARVIEGNHGVSSVSLSVTLSAPVSQPVRVSFSTVAGSAIEVEDYDRASGVIEFAPGELTRSIELHVIGDTFPEPDESFSVLLSNPVNATIDTASAVIVIANDDQVPPRHRPSRH